MGVLSREEEVELLVKAKGGDKDAVTQIVSAHMNQVMGLLTQFYGHDPQELLSPALFGLLEAIHRFDITRGLRFATFLPYRVRLQVTRFIYQELNLPENYLTRMRLVNRMGGWKVFYDYMDDPDWSERIPDTMVPSSEQVLLMREERKRVRECLSILDERERDIVVKHRMMNDGECRLEDIALEYGLTRERVRQIEREALGKLKRFITKGIRPSVKRYDKRTKSISPNIIKEGDGEMKRVVRVLNYNKVTLCLVEFMRRDYERETGSDPIYTVTGMEWQGWVADKSTVDMILNKGHGFNLSEVDPVLTGECLVNNVVGQRERVEFAVLGPLLENGKEVK